VRHADAEIQERKKQEFPGKRINRIMITIIPILMNMTVMVLIPTIMMIRKVKKAPTIIPGSR
jgi:hypothetical protein